MNAPSIIVCHALLQSLLSYSIIILDGTVKIASASFPIHLVRVGQQKRTLQHRFIPFTFREIIIPIGDHRDIYFIVSSTNEDTKREKRLQRANPNKRPSLEHKCKISAMGSAFYIYFL